MPEVGGEECREANSPSSGALIHRRLRAWPKDGGDRCKDQCNSAAYVGQIRARQKTTGLGQVEQLT